MYCVTYTQWCALEASNNPSLELEVPMEGFGSFGSYRPSNTLCAIGSFQWPFIGIGRPLEASNHHSN